MPDVDLSKIKAFLEQESTERELTEDDIRKDGVIDAYCIGKSDFAKLILAHMEHGTLNDIDFGARG